MRPLLSVVFTPSAADERGQAFDRRVFQNFVGQLLLLPGQWRQKKWIPEPVKYPE